jgi:hypothetical protein
VDQQRRGVCSGLSTDFFSFQPVACFSSGFFTSRLSRFGHFLSLLLANLEMQLAGFVTALPQQPAGETSL